MPTAKSKGLKLQIALSQRGRETCSAHISVELTGPVHIGPRQMSIPGVSALSQAKDFAGLFLWKMGRLMAGAQQDARALASSSIALTENGDVTATVKFKLSDAPEYSEEVTVILDKVDDMTVA